MSYKKFQLILIYFLSSLGVVILYNFNPAQSTNFYPPSLSREWGGFYCPGCGTLRGLHQLLRGNWQAAFRFNPLLIIGLPYWLYWITPCFLKYFYNLDTYQIQHKNTQVAMIIVIVLFYTILRNTSIPSLFWLVPPAQLFL